MVKNALKLLETLQNLGICLESSTKYHRSGCICHKIVKKVKEIVENIKECLQNNVKMVENTPKICENDTKINQNVVKVVKFIPKLREMSSKYYKNCLKSSKIISKIVEFLAKISVNMTKILENLIICPKKKIIKNVENMSKYWKKLLFLYNNRRIFKQFPTYLKKFLKSHQFFNHLNVFLNDFYSILIEILKN